MECEYYNRCLNNDKCTRCFNKVLLKEKKDKFKPKTHKKIATNKTKVDEKDTWKDLEQEVANAINRIPTMESARRTRRSGGLWFETGDIKDFLLHPECKERKGTELKSGEKSMSIKREWLEKAKEECRFNQKTMCLPFRFVGDEHTYCIFDFDDIATLVTVCKAYMQDNELKDKELELLKEKINYVKNIE